jgi:hypothetical protein
MFHQKKNKEYEADDQIIMIPQLRHLYSMTIVLGQDFQNRLLELPLDTLGREVVM